MAANLRFLRGTYASLVNKPKVDGTIYITTDEPGLYVDYGSDRLRIGDYRIFPNLTALQSHYTTANLKPSSTCLYYLSEDNILACYDETNDTFKQINSQKALGQLLKSFGVTVSASNNSASVIHTITGSDNQTKSGEVIFKSANANSLGVTADADKKEVIFRAKEENVSATLGTANNTVTLTTSKTGTNAVGTSINSSATSTVTFAGDGVSVATTNAGDKATITISSKDKLKTEIVDGSVITTLQRNGSTTDTHSASFTPTITYTAKAGTQTVNIDTNGNFTLPIYSAEKVDDLLSALEARADAMRFKGGIADITALSALSKVQIGDTYVVTKSGSFSVYVNGSTSASTVTAQPGDLLIAEGTETGGVIASNVKWHYIPSADDTVTLSATGVTDGFVIQSKQGAAPAASVVEFVGDDIVKINYKDGQAAFSHYKSQTKPTGTREGQENGTDQEPEDVIKNIVTGITYDDYGHVTGFTYRDVVVRNTRVKSVSNSLGTTYTNLTQNSKVEILTTLTDTQNQTASSQFVLAAATNSAVALQTSVDAETSAPIVSIGLIWEDF